MYYKLERPYRWMFALLLEQRFDGLYASNGGRGARAYYFKVRVQVHLSECEL